ncbi:MAG TPA: hypothetical protein VE174_13490 [Actinomycetota bacterium]|nr:hypothetical protein [Actinomycetota bacterium]
MRSNYCVDLYWLPLGAGGHFVRFNGRVYEAIDARLEHREAGDLYHSALVITVPEGRFVIEDAWPIPDGEGASRGVVVEGPVGSSRFGRIRAFRYEVRCWRDGVISDVAYAVASPQRISDQEIPSRHILRLVASVPPLTWGRRPAGTSEMWNSNSVISWLLARSGIDVQAIHPPTGGRAPGWATGIRLATGTSSTSTEYEGASTNDLEGSRSGNRRAAAGNDPGP